MAELYSVDNPEEELFHIGTPHEGSIPHSGRYEWGSGENPSQRSTNFLTEYESYKKKGFTEAKIAEAMGFKSTVELRAKKTIAVNEVKAANVARALRLQEHNGWGPTEIGRAMGVSESTVRGWLKSADDNKKNILYSTTDMLKNAVGEKGFIDVGKGVERELGISKDKLNTAVAMCKEEGYEVYTIKVPQATSPGNYTTVKVLAPPGTEWKDVNSNKGNIQSIMDYSRDGGKTYTPIQSPTSIDSSRILVRYGDEGGKDKDGYIQIRPGVKDLTLGKSDYAQVRIAVDGTHYLKGMAAYSDDIPEGYDIIFNTNKSKDVPVMGEKSNTIFKPLKSDPNNRFGALIKANGQTYYEDPNGNYIKIGESYVPKQRHKLKEGETLYSLSPINKIKEEGDWENYSKTLSSQFLSKQSLTLIKRQLNLTYANKVDELREIQELTNPVIKKQLLESFASDCDASAVHLKVAALPKQTSKVILPVDSLKDDQCYAPTYANGTKLALIRYPHGGTFEIPIVTVNNNHAEGKRVVGSKSVDAIGINVRTAGILSGADFDGDTVVAIPITDKVKIKGGTVLKGLKGFDPSDAYPGYPGMKVISPDNKQRQMGIVSNLITDMTIQGATPEELARAVKHSMVVIDAEKHELNYKLSYEVNGIRALQERYQKGGASTLISRAKSIERIPEKKKKWTPDPETGEERYYETGRTYLDKNGEVVDATMKITRMANTKDAYTLVSSMNSEKECAYADYANKLKALANESRKEALAIKPYKVSPSARETYSGEVDALEAKLDLALKNAPKERQAQLAAAAEVKKAYQIDPQMDKEHKKKVATQALANARVKYGANKSDVQIQITDKEWEAIQNKAISSSKLSEIIRNSDQDKIRKLATPRSQNIVSPSMKNKMLAMARSGFSLAEIADACGVSPSTVSEYVKE